MRLWTEDPLAIPAEDAARGLVVEDGRITELVPAGGKPADPVEAVFEAWVLFVLGCP